MVILYGARYRTKLPNLLQSLWVSANVQKMRACVLNLMSKASIKMRARIMNISSILHVCACLCHKRVHLPTPICNILS